MATNSIDTSRKPPKLCDNSLPSEPRPVSFSSKNAKATQCAPDHSNDLSPGEESLANGSLTTPGFRSSANHRHGYLKCSNGTGDGYGDGTLALEGRLRKTKDKRWDGIECHATPWYNFPTYHCIVGPTSYHGIIYDTAWYSGYPVWHGRAPPYDMVWYRCCTMIWMDGGYGHCRYSVTGQVSRSTYCATHRMIVDTLSPKETNILSLPSATCALLLEYA